MTIALDRFPRAKLIFLPTPLTELKNLSAHLGGPRIFIKRDDLTGLAMGGNKTRKLEFLLGEARAQGCDTVLTCGSIQSNHSRQTAGAAAALGLECHLALAGDPPREATGNLLLDRIFEAHVHWAGEDEFGAGLPALAEELASAGRKPYIVPYGGSNRIGSLGFVAAMAEIQAQCDKLGLSPDIIVTPSASGGTQAGMVVGVGMIDQNIDIIGISIDKGASGKSAYEAEMVEIGNRTADLMGINPHYSESDFQVDYDSFGQGYGVVGDPEREAIRLVATLEGILLDPVYTGRTMAGLIRLVREGRLKPGRTVIFWHTGGLPAIFVKGDELVDD